MVEVHGYSGGTYPSSGWKCKPSSHTPKANRVRAKASVAIGCKVDKKEPIRAKEIGLKG
jgi:hypothetical protein